MRSETRLAGPSVKGLRGRGERKEGGREQIEIAMKQTIQTPTLCAILFVCKREDSKYGILRDT